MGGLAVHFGAGEAGHLYRDCPEPEAPTIAARAKDKSQSKSGLLTQGVPFGPEAPSRDTLKPTENTPRTPGFGPRDLWLSGSYHPKSKCFNCGEVGRIASACPCYNCRVCGNIARDCPIESDTSD